MAYDKELFRSCVSRCYYAAFSAVTSRLTSTKSYTFPKGRETPPHGKIPDLIRRHLTEMQEQDRHRMKAQIRRVYNNRLNADYRSRALVDQATALLVRRDTWGICQSLGLLK